MLKAKFARNGQVTGDDRVDEKTGVVTRSEVRDAMKVQRLRRASLDICQTDETRRRIQEFLTRDIPGTRSEPLGQLNGKNVGSDHEFEERNLKESESQGDNKRNIPTLKPFKVRSRSSGICFSCSHCHTQPLPSASVPNMARKCSEEYRLSVPWKSSKAQLRKLSVPMAAADQMSLDRNRVYDVNTPCLPSTGSDITSRGIYLTRTNLNPAPTKKHNI